MFAYPFLTQIVLWFNLSPQSRYGGDTAIVVFFSLIFAILFLSLKFDKNKLIYGLISVIFLSLLYFEYKNISRISNEYFFSSKSNINFPWSNITEFEIGNDYFIQVSASRTSDYGQYVLALYTTTTNDVFENAFEIGAQKDSLTCSADNLYDNVFATAYSNSLTIGGTVGRGCCFDFLCHRTLGIRRFC